jgi:WD40 repeat protein
VRFGDARLRHTKPVTSLALTADGTRVLTATEKEPVLRLWDVKSGRLVRAVRVEEEFTASVTVLGITPDARRAFVVRHQWRKRENDSRWHEPATIDLATGAITRRWPLGVDYTGPPLVYALSPDGKTLAGIVDGAAGGGVEPDNQVRVWDFDSGAPRVLGRFASGNRYTGNICFSPDAAQIAACRGTSEFCIAPVNGNGPLQSIPVTCDGSGVRAVFWLQPNRVIAFWTNGMAAFDPTTGAEIARAERSPNNAYSFPAQATGGTHFVEEFYNSLSEGRYGFAVARDRSVYAVANGHTVRLFDPRTGTPLHPELEHEPFEPLARLHVSPDGAILLACTDTNAYTRNLSDGRALAELDGRSRWLAARFALSPDGRFACVGLSNEWCPQVVEVRTGRRLPHPFAEDITTEAAGFAGNGRVWLWNTFANTFTPVEIGTNRAGAAVPGFAEAEFVAVSPDGRKLAAAGRKGLAVRDLEAGRGWVVLDTYEERMKVPRCGPACGIPARFSPCGRWLLVSDAALELWDVRNKPLCVGRFGSADFSQQLRGDGSFSPDGRFLAAPVRSPDGASELCVWETASAQEVYRFRPARGVAGCAFTPDGRRLIISHNDTTLSVWDRTGVEARQLGTVSAGEEWRWLGSRDAKQAHAAVRALVTNPQRALAVLTPAFALPDAATTNRLIAELGAEEFRVRESAERALGAMGLSAEPALRSAVTKSESPEVRARAAALLKALGPTEGPLAGERLRAVREVEVLERIASPQAKALLALWATHPNSSLNAEASAALARLAKK